MAITVVKEFSITVGVFYTDFYGYRGGEAGSAVPTQDLKDYPDANMSYFETRYRDRSPQDAIMFINPTNIPSGYIDGAYIVEKDEYFLLPGYTNQDYLGIARENLWFGDQGVPPYIFDQADLGQTFTVRLYNGIPTPAPDITAITKVGANPSCSYPSNGTCTSSRQYSAVVADASIIDSYTWTVTNNGTITSGQGTSNIIVSTTADSNQTITVTCLVTNETGTDSLAINDTHTKTLAKPSIVSIIPDGSVPFCEYPAGGDCQTSRDYTVVTSDPGGVSSYTWSVAGNATISGGQGTTVVTVVVVSGNSEVIDITCVAANPTGSDSFTVADTHERVLEPSPGSPVIPGPLAFEDIPTISTISPLYGTGIAITATEVNKIISGINDVWADTNESATSINSASMGYGQVSDIPSVSATAEVDNDDWNGMFSAIDKMSKHQGVVKPIELPLRVEDFEDIAAYSSLIPTINVLRTNKMSYDISQMSSTTNGAGTKSTRTTLWTGSVTHSYNVTFGSWDEIRYFFNTGGELRFSASRTGGSNNSQNTAMSNLFTAIGTGKLAYNQTLRNDNLPANNLGFYDLTETYQTIYLGTGSEAFSGDSYRVEAKLNGISGSANEIGIRVTMSETAGDPGIDGTTVSYADYQIADSTEVSVPVPTFTTTDNL